MAVEEYIGAIMSKKVLTLLKALLSYRPAERYDAVLEYNNVSQALVSA